LKILETERLVLRRLNADDAGFILELLNEPSFLQYIGDKGVRNHEDAVRYIQNGPIASYERFGFGLYRVELKDTGDSIGICGLLKRDTLEDVDLGFAFLPRFWLKGYAVESAAATIAYGRSVLGIKRIAAITNPDNAASIRVLEKIGFRFDRMVRMPEGEPELNLYLSDVSATA
jgi:RimJ/RimL family protein N-acetyltransferase